MSGPDEPYRPDYNQNLTWGMSHDYTAAEMAARERAAAERDRLDEVMDNANQQGIELARMVQAAEAARIERARQEAAQALLRDAPSVWLGPERDLEQARVNAQELAEKLEQERLARVRAEHDSPERIAAIQRHLEARGIDPDLIAVRMLVEAGNSLPVEEAARARATDREVRERDREALEQSRERESRDLGHERER